ncbi:MAG: serine O-acetyltransferase [Candidatus Ancillula sp.]|jgi:serine O-acetyltransferase|nr:serine O-acetyltransferase [Candidatus Ancillula sp.]
MSFFQDIKAVKRADPAVRYGLEVLFFYPGMWAIWFYRFCHFLWKIHLKFISRLIMTIIRWLTGVEIHPGAMIGKRFVIDHGMGVVIGETAIIGDDCMMYHGVTLGGRGHSKEGRRHPKLGDNVVIGAGASILGPVTICKGAKIGAGAVVLNDVFEDETYVGQKARSVITK